MATNTRTHFLDLFASGEIDKLLHELKSFWTQSKDADKVNQVTLIMSQLHDLKRENRMQIIDRAQYITEYARLKDSISELIQLVPDPVRKSVFGLKAATFWILAGGFGLVILIGGYYFNNRQIDHGNPIPDNRIYRDSQIVNTVPGRADTGHPKIKPKTNESNTGAQKAIFFSGCVLDATQKTPIVGSKLRFSDIELTTSGIGNFKSNDLRQKISETSFFQVTITASGYKSRVENVFTTDLNNKFFYLAPQ
jgi:hypothetical protein